MNKSEIVSEYMTREFMASTLKSPPLLDSLKKKLSDKKCVKMIYQYQQAVKNSRWIEINKILWKSHMATVLSCSPHLDPYVTCIVYLEHKKHQEPQEEIKMAPVKGIPIIKPRHKQHGWVWDI